MPVFKIHHITKYEYERPVSESINEIRIYPFQCPEQEVLQHDLLVTGQEVLAAFALASVALRALMRRLADQRSLSAAEVARKDERRIQMGIQVTEGLGAGSRPDIGEAAAIETLEEAIRRIDKEDPA